tara:strand:+ start:18715 stop:19497 length:783 start_codon:yes stop_codon:yes gene_type:complete
MRLDEINNTWTKSQLNLLYKAARSDQQAYSNKGNPKVNQDGTAKMKSSPLSSRYGQQRALRGEPSDENPNGKLVGAGGKMHDPIEPAEARKMLQKYAGDASSGLAPRYGELPDQAYTWDAMRNRDRRSAPNREAKWKDGEGSDVRSRLKGQKRMMMTPSGKRVTSNRPPKQKTGPKQSSEPPAASITDPTMVKSMAQRIADKKQDRKERAKIEKKNLRQPPRRRYKRPTQGKRKGAKEDIDRSKSINEGFLQALDDSLGI